MTALRLGHGRLFDVVGHGMGMWTGAPAAETMSLAAEDVTGVVLDDCRVRLADRPHDSVVDHRPGRLG